MERLECALRRERLIVGASLVLVTVLAWTWLLAGAGMEMTAWEMTRHADMPMLEPARWTAGYALLMFSMWWVMMVAMMLPAATPVVLLGAALHRRSRALHPPFGRAAGFTAGYLLAWGAFSAVAVALQWVLEHSGLLTPMLVSASDRLAGLLLILAGLWQLAPWKLACLAHCRSPVEFLTRHRGRSALEIGAVHGLFCVGCCWFLMGLLFVGGVMNLYWIIALALYVWFEKLVPGGPVTARWVGAGLVVWGGWLALA